LLSGILPYGKVVFGYAKWYLTLLSGILPYGKVVFDYRQVVFTLR
jgi:hypothetical protein